MKQLIWGIFVVALCVSCSVKPAGIFSETKTPTPPDYSKSENWAALPTKADQADLTPDSTFKNIQEIAKIDVFFLHPTTYTGDKGQNLWNASCEDTICNVKTDGSTIRYQASIFNGAGRVYAPRYRQAHLGIFTVKEEHKRSAELAYKLAYSDVKSAFEYYLENFNEGRPIIIASHSQGTGHGKTLIKEFFDGKPLEKKLVAAYLVGWPVEDDFFESIKVCERPEETGCFCSWRTFKEGHKPKDYWKPNNNVIVTNPLTWTVEETPAPKSLNKGAVFYDFNKVYEEAVSAQVYDGILWANKPKFPGSFFMTRKNYHIADYNFYYANVRENAQLRAEVYLKTSPDKEGANENVTNPNN